MTPFAVRPMANQALVVIGRSTVTSRGGAVTLTVPAAA
jgi:hypothetical protein